MSDLSVSRSRVAAGALLPALPAAEVSKSAPVVVPAGTRGPAKTAKPNAAKEALHALRTEMLDTLHMVADHFRLRYGPAGWKQSQYGWSADSAEATAQKKIAAIVGKSGQTRDQMITAFHTVLREFVQGTRDYHVSISFARLGQAKLGFHVAPSADGRLFIVGIDRKALSKAAFPFEKGDELTSVDGRPVAELLKELLTFDAQSNPRTDLANAATRITSRRARVGEELPSKPTALLGITRRDGSQTTVDIAWTVKNERLAYQAPSTRALAVRAAKADHVGPDMSAQRYIDEGAIAEADTLGDGFIVGAKKSFVPTLGTVVSREPETSPFDAYIYRAPNGKNVGVIRVPTYGPDKPEECAKAFAALIARYEDATDALVIDQTNNPGGYFYYMQALLSQLSPNAMKMTGQQEAITPREVNEALTELDMMAGITDDKSAIKVLGKTHVGFPVTFDLVAKTRAYNQHIIDQWNAGKTFTDSFPLAGIGYTNPSAKPYTKPILCLVNGTCYSCGDFFPAALQTNKRAKIFGEQTAGAGGYVLTHKPVNGLGVEALRTTGSIADRGTQNPDGTISDDPTKLEHPIENLGVVPDVPYTLTSADMQNGFAGYRDAVNAEIVKLTS